VVQESCSVYGIDFGDSVEFVSDRPGHDLRYAINCEKAIRELGWGVITDFRSGLVEVLEWYRLHESWWCPKVVGRLGLI